MAESKEIEGKKYIYVGKPLPESCPAGQVEELFCESGVYPPRWAYCIGEISDALGKKSYFEMDKNCTGKSMMDRLIEEGIALSKTQYGTRQIKTENGYKFVDGAVTYYYLPYEQEDATFRLPTAIEPISLAVNVETDAIMEVLFTTGDEGWQRYITIPIKTKWPSISMIDTINNLKETIIDWAMDNENGFSIYMDDDENDEELAPLGVLFFDEMGNSSTLEFESVRELIHHIVSVRLVNVEKKDIEKNTRKGD